MGFKGIFGRGTALVILAFLMFAAVGSLTMVINEVQSPTDGIWVSLFTLIVLVIALGWFAGTAWFRKTSR